MGPQKGSHPQSRLLSRRHTDHFGVRGLCFPPGGGKGQRLRPPPPRHRVRRRPSPGLHSRGGQWGGRGCTHHHCLILRPRSLPALPADRCVPLPPALALLQAPAGRGAPSSQVPRQPLPASQGDQTASSTHPLPPSWLGGGELTECGQTGLTPGKGQGFPLPSPPTPYLPVSGTAGPCWPSSVRRPDFPHPLISCKLHTLAGRPGALPPLSGVRGGVRGSLWRSFPGACARLCPPC